MKATHSQTSQAGQILKHLQSGSRLTPRDARTLFHCDRLGARIYELKQEGHAISSHLVPVGNGKRVAEYYLTPAAGDAF